MGPSNFGETQISVQHFHLTVSRAMADFVDLKKKLDKHLIVREMV